MLICMRTCMYIEDHGVLMNCLTSETTCWSCSEPQPPQPPLQPDKDNKWHRHQEAGYQTSNESYDIEARNGIPKQNAWTMCSTISGGCLTSSLARPESAVLPASRTMSATHYMILL